MLGLTWGSHFSVPCLLSIPIVPLMPLMHSWAAPPPTAAVSAEPRDSGSFDQFLALKSQLATGSGNGALQSGGVTVRSC